MTPISDHLKKMDKRLKHWGSQFDELSQTALQIETDEKAAFDKRVALLRTKLDHAHARLEALRSSSEDKWEGFKADLEVAIRDFEKAFKHDVPPPASPPHPPGPGS